MFFAKWRLIKMKPINEMTDEEVLEELSTFQPSEEINLNDME